MPRVTHCSLVSQPIEPDVLRRSVEDPSLGGVVAFLGEVRSITGSEKTDKLEYECYAEMAESQMLAIASEAAERWHANVAVSHRVGELLPGDIAVVTVAACAHRAEAFDCCRFLIDRIKEDVPIWKKEFGPEGEGWVGETE